MALSASMSYRKTFSIFFTDGTASGLASGAAACPRAALTPVLGKYPVPTIVFTWLAFQYINLHNHDLWEEDRFPFKYWHYAAKMHHHHHARFTGGNYATITLLYDWMFGTLDYGNAPRRAARIKPA